MKRSFAAVACLGLLVAGTALSTTGNYSLVGSALAKNGNGGGEGGGKGNGGEGHGNAKADHADDKSKTKEADLSDNNLDKNTLGPLNAAHASARARERASPNSSVGKIAAYERSREAALAIKDPTLREQALAAAEAKLSIDFHRTLTTAQIDEVNDLLDARR
ncbi:Holotricin-3 precursor [Phyllobacterium myrsinacearum]|uniref:Holotricin-3 n=1 Tax=Phyllobacterium myrsinacearum TaxID=28101 RepID=A0A2S9JCC7_9HYPH|nr:Holotricin-3 precursor [Phyllobacterium myrsinacearum]